ncbi:MAG: formate dehydrogenase [Burkholderiaceae bacterium]
MGAKTEPSTNLPAHDAPTAQPLKRRGLVLGVGSAGAAALAVKLMPGAVPVAPATSVAKSAVSSVDAGGYRLSEHVRRYYETTRS